MSPRSVLLSALVLTTALSACAGRSPEGSAPGVGSTSVDWAGLTIEYRMLPSADDRLRVSASVENRTSGRVVRELPFCVVRLRLYLSDRLVWDEGRAEACAGIRTLDLRPGEVEDFWSSFTAERVLGDSLPEGDYLVRLYLPGSDRPGTIRTSMELTLAEKTLARPSTQSSGRSASIRAAR